MARRRKAHGGGHGNTERWLLTYADLITLLMVFFVVMFAMSRADSVKLSRLAASLQRAFNVGVLEGTVPTATDGELGAEDASAVVEAVGLPQEARTDFEQIRQALAEALTALRQHREAQGAEGLGALNGQNIQVGLSREGIVVSFSGSLLFDSGRAEIKPQAAGLLATLGEELAKRPNPVRVEGHTDNVPIDSPRYPTNWELSVARAVAVARYLTEQLGVGPQRVSAAGYGEYRPVASNETREGRARNRRVDIVILAPGAAPAGAGAVAPRPPVEQPIGPQAGGAPDRPAGG